MEEKINLWQNPCYSLVIFLPVEQGYVPVGKKQEKSKDIIMYDRNNLFILISKYYTTSFNSFPGDMQKEDT